MGVETEPYELYVPAPGEQGIKWGAKVSANFQKLNDDIVAVSGALADETTARSVAIAAEVVARNAAIAAQSLVPVSALTADVVAQGVGVWGAQRITPKFPTFSSVLTTFASGHGWTGGTDDTSKFRLGSRSLRVSCAVSPSTLTYVLSPAISPTIDVVANCLEFMVYLQGSTGNLTSFQVEASSDAGTTWVATNIYTINNLESDRWVTLRVNKDAFASIGTTSFTAINKLRVGARTTSGSVQSFWLQRIGVYAATETKASITICVEAYSPCYPVMDEFITRGMRPTLLARPFNVLNGLTNSMTLAQLQELHFSFGAGVIPMQWSNTEIDTGNYILDQPALFESGLLKCLHFFKDNGFERPRIWYNALASIGTTSYTRLAAALAYARTYFEGAISIGVETSNQPVNVYPIQNPYGLNCFYGGPYASAFIADFKNYVDRLIETKSHGVYVGQQFTTGASVLESNLIGRAELITMLDYIISKGSAIEVITANDFVKNRL